ARLRATCLSTGESIIVEGTPGVRGYRQRMLRCAIGDEVTLCCSNGSACGGDDRIVNENFTVEEIFLFEMASDGCGAIRPDAQRIECSAVLRGESASATCIFGGRSGQI
ncbi:MAG: hypothetical protein VYD19_03705, partial [Myxococcota bacterium]|nr:hypothetical protein [Myxococcota bacterium]